MTSSADRDVMSFCPMTCHLMCDIIFTQANERWLSLVIRHNRRNYIFTCQEFQTFRKNSKNFTGIKSCNMAEVRPSTSFRDESVVCPNCFCCYGEFWLIYSGKLSKLIELCQNHGVLLKEKQCDYCKSLCRLDISSLCFRCDKSYVRGHKKRKRCNFKVSIFNNSWFRHSHLDIETNLKFVVLFLQDCFSYKFVQSELGLSKPTINDWASFCREVIVHWVFNKSGGGKIGGQGNTVEIDESKFGRRKYNVGRLIEGQWVFGGICRETRESFMVPVPDRTGDTLLAGHA